MEIWHISGSPRVGTHSRAFANPKGFWLCLHMYFRGWKPFNPFWWSKPSKKLKQVLSFKNLLRD